MNSSQRPFLFLACCLAWPVLLGARGCDPDPVPIGGDDCDPARCGAALGLPSVVCADESLGGNTGRCLPTADGASCAWEVRECPITSCTDDQCGPVPPTLPGALLSCERIDASTCQWVVTSDPTCEPEACGPPPFLASYVCVDGSTGGFTGACINTADGTCGWEIIDCEPATDCTLEACGPMPGAPAYVCEDGSVGGNTGRCLRDPTTAVCGWEFRECPASEFCGGIAGIACGADEVCIANAGECHFADGGGVCVVPPEACDAEWAPVCGCDERTYSNACTAHASGMSIDHEGECVAESTGCGGFAGLACPPNAYCQYAAGDMCGAADQLGECVVIPEECDTLFAPVCGCDGVTYSNECEAARSTASIVHDGAC